MASCSSSFFVLVEFISSDKKKGIDLSVISSNNLKYCPTLEDADDIINQSVKVRHDAKGKPTEFYSAKVLAYSVSRPDLVALMSTYIKTGQLATPSNSKRPRIPKMLNSSSSSDSESGRANLPDAKKTKKLHRASKVSASLKAARSILHSYADQQKETLIDDMENCSDNSLDDDNTVSKLKTKINDQAATIKNLKAKLRAATMERDAMIETHEANKQMAADLRKSLKYARQLASSSTPSSSAPSSSAPTSQPGTRPNSALSGSGPEVLQPGVDHAHLRHKSSDTGVVQLGRSSISVNGVNLTTVVSTSSSCTMLCRNLLELVYTSEALESCSVRGRKSNGFGKGVAEAREPLYQIGINAIIDFTISQGKASHWKIQDPSACVAAMGKRLNEIRNVIKLSGVTNETREQES